MHLRGPFQSATDITENTDTITDIGTDVSIYFAASAGVVIVLVSV
ncbi:MAG: hypothetical protein ACTSQZ_03535 [Candidatus Thorarchaeota archaeon]